MFLHEMSPSLTLQIYGKVYETCLSKNNVIWQFLKHDQKKEWQSKIWIKDFLGRLDKKKKSLLLRNNPQANHDSLYLYPTVNVNQNDWSKIAVKLGSGKYYFNTEETRVKTKLK